MPPKDRRFRAPIARLRLELGVAQQRAPDGATSYGWERGWSPVFDQARFSELTPDVLFIEWDLVFGQEVAEFVLEGSCAVVSLLVCDVGFQCLQL
jgi:hypothetical protein